MNCAWMHCTNYPATVIVIDLNGQRGSFCNTHALAVADLKAKRAQRESAEFSPSQAGHYDGGKL